MATCILQVDGLSKDPQVCGVTHNPTFFVLTASKERRLLVYLKGWSHDGVSKAQ